VCLGGKAMIQKCERNIGKVIKAIYKCITSLCVTNEACKEDREKFATRYEGLHSYFLLRHVYNNLWPTTRHFSSVSLLYDIHKKRKIFIGNFRFCTLTRRVLSLVKQLKMSKNYFEIQTTFKHYQKLQSIM
jgi:hypothetical protein